MNFYQTDDIPADLKEYFQPAPQIGLEPTFSEYLDKMLAVTSELRRVLKKTGTMWWNHGDCYGGPAHADWSSSNPEIAKKYQKNNQMVDFSERNLRKGAEKCLLLQPYRLAIRMVDEQGWIVRNQIIWHKPNAMPSSVKDRFTVDYEPIFFFTKSKKYWFEQQFEPFQSSPDQRWGGQYFNLRVRDAEKGKSAQYRAGEKEKAQYGAVLRDKRDMFPKKEGRGKRAVWKIATKPYAEAHFATFPPALIETPIKAGCPVGGVVLDPFAGSGTTAMVARNLGRDYCGIELNKSYVELINNRLAKKKMIT